MMANTPTKRRPLVLLVDDDELQLLPAREVLASSGFDTIEADCGSSALPLFEQRHPDIILLDVQMPGIDGYEVCARIRATAAGRHVPVLMMTGLDDLESIRRAYDVGATDFVAKPVNWLILGHRIEYMLRASHDSRELRESQVKLETAQRIARLGSWEWDLSSGVLHCSLEARRILGLDVQQRSRIEMQQLLDHVAQEDRGRVQTFVSALLAGKGVHEIEYRVHDDNGAMRFIRQRAEVAEGDEGALLTGTVQDVTEQRRAAERIRFLANYDALTGLPNRQSFSDSLSSELEGALDDGERLALLLLDIDRFKRVNDTLGPQAGDRLLQQIAERLVAAGAGIGKARSSTPIVSRLGGDEFALLCPDLGNSAEAARLLRRVQDEFRTPFAVADQSIRMGCSIGGAIWPDDAIIAEALVSNANAAMQHAKREGGNCAHFYSESMNRTALDQLVLENELRSALDRGELVQFYQPQFDFNGKIVGVEALTRWRHPERGLIAPAQFIPIAEENGHIVEIGAWALKEACLQATEWRHQGHGQIRVAVNLSVRQLRPELLATVEEALRDSRIDPQLLTLELTESMLLRDLEEILDLLRAIKKKGVKLCVDDFGTGYSSLSYLSRLPLDSLKIDRSFVQGLPDDADQLALVRAILAMAKSLQLRVVAEGVETEPQAELLKHEGCDELQGFLLGRPMPPEKLEQRLRELGQRAAAAERARTLEFPVLHHSV